MTIHLDPEHGLAVFGRLGLQLRDEGLFFSALARPAASVFGADAYENIELKAAMLVLSIAQHHALFDGNKRTSWVIMVAFLNINGLDLRMGEDVKFELVLAVAGGSVELEELSSVLRRHLVTIAP